MRHRFARTRGSSWLARIAVIGAVLGACVAGTAGTAGAVSNPCTVFFYPKYNIYGGVCDVTTTTVTAGVGANTYGSYDDWAGIPSFITDTIPPNVQRIINQVIINHLATSLPGAQAFFGVGLPIDDIDIGPGVGVDNEITVVVCDGPYYSTGLLGCHYYHPKLP